MRNPPRGKGSHEPGSALKVKPVHVASLLLPNLALPARPLFGRVLASSLLLCVRWLGTSTTLLDGESQLVDVCLGELGRGKGINLAISHLSSGHARLVRSGE